MVYTKKLFKKQYIIFIFSLREGGKGKVLFLKRLDIQMVKTSSTLFYLS